jgi:anti-sigma B factor antagonist
VTILAKMTREVHGDVPVLKIDGEIDAGNAAELTAELRTLLSNASFAIVADISGVTYFDSAGLNALAVVHSELDRRQQHLHVVAPPGTRGHRLLAITNLDRVLSVHEDLDHALRAARGHV